MQYGLYTLVQQQVEVVVLSFRRDDPEVNVAVHAPLSLWRLLRWCTKPTPPWS
jgi:hypothetical protein